MTNSEQLRSSLHEIVLDPSYAMLEYATSFISYSQTMAGSSISSSFIQHAELEVLSASPYVHIPSLFNNSNIYR